MLVETFLGISIKHDDGTVQRFILANDECTVTEDLSEAIVRKNGKHIGNTSNEGWDYDVYLYQNEYYASAGILAPEILGNPPLMTRLLPLDDVAQEAMKLLNEWYKWYQPNGVPNGYERRLADFLEKHKGA